MSPDRSECWRKRITNRSEESIRLEESQAVLILWPLYLVELMEKCGTANIMTQIPFLPLQRPDLYHSVPLSNNEANIRDISGTMPALFLLAPG